MAAFLKCGKQAVDDDMTVNASAVYCWATREALLLRDDPAYEARNI